MKKESIYKSLIVLLLVINLVQISGHFFSPKPPHHSQAKSPPMPPPHAMQSSPTHIKGALFLKQAMQLLQLDGEQKQQFLKLAKAHESHMSKLQKQQSELTLNYFQQPAAELLENIANLDKQKVTLTEAHFGDVYQLLTPEQQPNFSAFKQAALQVIIR